jgi:hypothetical protein
MWLFLPKSTCSPFAEWFARCTSLFRAGAERTVTATAAIGEEEAGT